MTHHESARRRAFAALGTGALALALAGCATGGGAPEPTAETPASPTASATTDPTTAAAAAVASAKASSVAEGTRRPEPREALETVGPGIRDGAASAGWKATATRKNNTVSVMNCTTDVLDQRTLDAVATHIPDAGTIEIAELFASVDENGEFLTCTYNGGFEASPGMPLAQIHYQHSLKDTRLDWCRTEPAAVADEYSFDESTGKGLLALLRPGMTGGPDGAPLLPQRTAWACTPDGTEMVSISFGAMAGYGDANEGLTKVTNSPVAQSTTLVTEARDGLADTVLKDPSRLREVIQMSTPYFLDAQTDEETLAKARAIPAGRVPKEMLTDQSTIERPEGAPGPVAPGEPPRPFQGAAASAASSAAAASSSATAGQDGEGDVQQDGEQQNNEQNDETGGVEPSPAVSPTQG